MCARWFFLALLLIASSATADSEQVTYFKDTEYELNIFYINGTEKGNTMLIIGGIQGDEPGGYLAADLYVDLSLRKGSLIVIPRANFDSILRNHRGINGDMNRKFASIKENDPDIGIVEILKENIAKADVLLNLHEGSGFFREHYIDELHNPKKYGQCIIADEEEYYSRGKNKLLPLGQYARRVIEKINKNIKNKQHHFRFNNHRTSQNDTEHPEQRKSATYFALMNYEIPAFGIEASKNIRSIETKVYYETLAINSFMEEFDIIPANPRIYLPTPKLTYMVINVDNANATMVENGGTLRILPGESIQISHVEVNYERGITVDVLGMGKSHDLRKSFQITSPTQVIVKKDSYPCGKISIIPDSKVSPIVITENPSFQYLILKINDDKQWVFPSDTIHVYKGDIFEICDAEFKGGYPHKLKVNFRGFVSDQRNNTGEDRNHPIRIDQDLKNFIRLSTDGYGRVYRINITYADEKIGEVFVRIHNPRFEYVLVKRINKTMQAYRDGDTITGNWGELLNIYDIITNKNYTNKIKYKIGDGPLMSFDNNHNIKLEKNIFQNEKIYGNIAKTTILFYIGEDPVGKLFLSVS